MKTILPAWRLWANFKIFMTVGVRLVSSFRAFLPMTAFWVCHLLIVFELMRYSLFRLSFSFFIYHYYGFTFDHFTNDLRCNFDISHCTSNFSYDIDYFNHIKLVDWFLKFELFRQSDQNWSNMVGYMGNWPWFKSDHIIGYIGQCWSCDANQYIFEQVSSILQCFEKQIHSWFYRFKCGHSFPGIPFL